MVMRRKKMHRFTGQYLVLMSLFVLIVIIVTPSFSFGLTIFQTSDDTILFTEMYPNVTFQNFGFNIVSNVSHVSKITDTTNTISVDFTFTLDGTSYSGIEAWES